MCPWPWESSSREQGSDGEQVKKRHIDKFPVSEIWFLKHTFSSVQSLTFVQLFAIPWTAWMPGFPVHHYLPEFAHTHIHRVAEAIQPSVVLSSFCLQSFQHQGLFK